MRLRHLISRAAAASALIVLIAMQGCASLQTPDPMPDPASATAITVRLSNTSSLSLAIPERAMQVAALLSKYESHDASWRPLSRTEPRYRLLITYEDGSEVAFSINDDSISRGETGRRSIALGPAQLRELDTTILGENPYQRFHTLALDET